jgi:hypothetical protein
MGRDDRSLQPTDLAGRSLRRFARNTKQNRKDWDCAGCDVIAAGRRARHAVPLLKKRRNHAITTKHTTTSRPNFWPEAWR